LTLRLSDEPKRERRADAEPTGYGDIASHRTRELSADRKSQAGAAVLIGSCHLAEGFKYHLEVLRGDATPRIFDLNIGPRPLTII
jgi:hypothetical protein